jgi:hypothetical protein
MAHKKTFSTASVTLDQARPSCPPFDVRFASNATYLLRCNEMTEGPLAGTNTKEPPLFVKQHLPV